VRTVVVYVHGLWLNGWESLLLRQRLSRQLDCTRCRSRTPRSGRGSCECSARSRHSSHGCMPTLCTWWATAWAVPLFSSYSRARWHVALPPHAGDRFRRAGSCCSAPRFEAAAPPAISRSFASAGACSASRRTKRYSPSAIGNGAAPRELGIIAGTCPWASGASWGLSTLRAMGRYWSRRRISRGEAASEHAHDTLWHGVFCPRRASGGLVLASRALRHQSRQT
jgi:hypothetical protein